MGARVEHLLDSERDQLALWVPVALGVGIAAWFVLETPAQWQAWLLGMAALACGSVLLPGGGRMRRVILVAAIASAVGCGAIWARANWVAGPVLTHPVVAQFSARIEQVEVQTAKDRVRLTLLPVDAPTLPPRVRVTVDDVTTSVGLVAGDSVSLRARLVGPPNASVPGGFDFSRVAWFQGLGATGKAMGPVTRIGPAEAQESGLRDRLSAHIRGKLAGSAGGIASAFATGDRGGIAQEDEDSMRASGLTHLLSVMRALGAKGDEGLLVRLGRAVLGLLITGVVVEAALAPIALFHFHKSGLYGAFANIIAIPLTTFVIMPLEALALLFDTVGLGAPFWWLTGLSLNALLGLSHLVSGVPGAQAALTSVPVAAFGLMIGGGLWLMLWRGRVRIWGVLPILGGAAWALLTPPPDLLITGDGMHMAVRGGDGTLSTLRPRAGDYVRSVLGERSGELGELGDLDGLPEANCSTDTCRVSLTRGGRDWRVLATRSRYMLPPVELRSECAGAHIVVSDRRLPDWCRPRWFKADRALLAQTGGIAVTLASGRVETVAEGEGAHPWVMARGR